VWPKFAVDYGLFLVAWSQLLHHIRELVIYNQAESMPVPKKEGYATDFF
jgi:hypothetical protein